MIRCPKCGMWAYKVDFINHEYKCDCGWDSKKEKQDPVDRTDKLISDIREIVK